MPWPRRNSPSDDSPAAIPKVEVHTTWMGRQYVNVEELMRHPDVVETVKQLGEILGPVIAREQRRLRARRHGS